VRLPLPGCVQRGVELALKAAVGIPLRPAMPQQDDASPGTGAQESDAARGVTVSVNGIAGQSFHSRSRA